MGVFQNGGAVFLLSTHVERTRRGGSGKSLAGGRFRAMTSVEHPPRRLERRWAQRYSFRAELEIEWGSAVFCARNRAISASGKFFRAAPPPWVWGGVFSRPAPQHQPRTAGVSA